MRREKFSNPIVYVNVPPNAHGGGPSVFSYKFQKALSNKYVFVKKDNADLYFGIITAPQHADLVRLNGIYNKEYSLLFNRKVSADQVSLHKNIIQNLKNKNNHIVYQSEWSRKRISEELYHRVDNFSVIHNGSDENLFFPTNDKHDTLTLIYVGQLRDAYMSFTLVGVLDFVKKYMPVKMILVGRKQSDFIIPDRDDLVYVDNVSNNQLNSILNKADIFISPRQGASCSNVISEAQLSGLPVVVPSWGGDCEMVGKDSGIVVNTGRWTYDAEYVKNIGDAVISIFNNLSTYKYNARKNGIDKLSLKQMANEYSTLMDKRLL